MAAERSTNDPGVRKSPSQTPERVRERTRKQRSTLEGRLKNAESQAYAKARKLGVPAERLDYLAILVRDRGTCYLCGGQIDLNAPPRAWNGPAFDHRIPLNWGGPHQAFNVSAVHLQCMGKKARNAI